MIHTVRRKTRNQGAGIDNVVESDDFSIILLPHLVEVFEVQEELLVIDCCLATLGRLLGMEWVCRSEEAIPRYHQMVRPFIRETIYAANIMNEDDVFQ